MIDFSKEISQGILKAQKKHIDWTGGLGIGHGAEYMLTTYIAENIFASKNKKNFNTLTIEQNVETIAEKDGIDATKLRRGRFDICIGGDDNRYTIIEVKNTVTNRGNRLNSILKDIVRIQPFLLNDNCVKQGYIAFVAANYIQDKHLSQKEIIIQKLENRISQFIKCFTNSFPAIKIEPQYDTHIETNKDKKIWCWADVVLKITKKNLLSPIPNE